MIILLRGNQRLVLDTLKRVREKVSLRFCSMIRPRAGNQFYSDEECTITQADVRICGEQNCDQVSVGVLNREWQD